MAIKKYSKVKFTLRKELVMILAAIVVLIVATILLNLPTKEEKFVNKWVEAGAQITENELYVEVSFDELEDELSGKQAGEYTFVLFTTPSDADGVTYFNTVISLAELYGVEKVYLVDSEFVVGKDREEDSEFDAELKDIEDNFKTEEGTELKLDAVSNFWVFNGDTLIDCVDNYTANDTPNWGLALVQMLTYAKAN